LTEDFVDSHFGVRRGSPHSKDCSVGPMKITLRVIAGPHKGREFAFRGHDTFLVGRSERVHFRLASKDKYFSRIHFMVEVNPPHCRLMDMGSRNGTYVNDKKVSQADLKAGDRIRAGRTILVLSMKKSRRAVVPVAKPFRPPPEVRGRKSEVR